MLEKVGSKLFLIGLLSLVSILLLTVKDPPFRKGLDLAGGTRLVYHVDLEQAYEIGTLDRQLEPPDQVMDQMISIIRSRVDPKGVTSPIIRRGGGNTIVIELPGQLGTPAQAKSTTLVQDAGEVALQLVVADAEQWPDSGVVQIGDEKIRYGERLGTRLTRLERQQNGTPLSAHVAGDTVVLAKNDAFRAAIESLGELEFRIVADASNMPEGTDLAKERKKKDDWVAANPGVSLSAFNKTKPEEGGPHPDLEWLPFAAKSEAMQLLSEAERAQDPVYRPTKEAYRFRGDDLAKVYPTTDRIGYPAVGFELVTERKQDLADFTEEYQGKRMAIVLNGQIDVAATINSVLPGGGIIEGRYTNQEVKDLLTVFRSGSLKIRPELRDDERVSATLGEDYIRLGTYSAIVSLVLLLAFIIAYYRRLGLIAASSLAMSFLLLLGGLSFLDATLTLPGIAGLILTLGMAVDANILIFDRMREEGEKGRNLKQAAKEGFDRSRPAILDANITTFLTAVILYNVGTGPLRGFAVTLMVGILTSVFAALVITRVLVHFALVRGAKSFPVGKWMVEAAYSFLSKARLAIAISAVAVVGSLALFALTPNHERFGIDFVGGAEAQLRTAKPETVATVRERVGAIPGPIGESADVKAVLNTEQGDGLYTHFRATFKAGGGAGGDLEGTDVRSTLQTELADLLLQDWSQISIREGESEALVEMKLLFTEGHPTTDIANLASGIGLRDVEVNATEVPDQYLVSAKTAAGRSAAELREALEEERARVGEDSTGRPFRFATSIPDYSSVGPQVVGELRDKALLAMAISLFVIVLYIRVRFAEYSWGFAAVAALVHDVSITLGVLMLANKIGFLNGELTLPMVGAFLTIIGYSLNDTIVIFDRVRENLPRTRKPLSEVLDLSINQTLSRTVLTSLTTLMSVTILYVFNMGTGSVLETFAFAMVIGVLVGTYSTIFVANPVFLWLEKRSGRLDDKGRLIPKEEEAKAKRSSTAAVPQV